MLDKNRFRKFYRLILYPIGPTSKLYVENQATIKTFLEDKISPQSRPLDFLITALHDIHLRKCFGMVDTRSNMQLSSLSSKPHEDKSLRYIVDRAIGVHF